MRGRAIAMGAAAVLSLVLAQGARAAGHDDLIGIWMVQTGYRLLDKLMPEPQLTPAAEAWRQRRMAAQAKGYARQVPNMLCQGVGGPAMFQNQSPFEVFSGFGRITFVFENEYQVQPRTVYLNEKEQPPHIFPSYNGHSIGHWEGDVLVVDTVGYNGRSSHRGNWLGGIPRSDKAHTIERFSVSPDGKVLSDQITTIDPETFAVPWTTTLKFDRQPNDTERFEVTCEVDLDALNATDLKPLKDVDPEVARLIDPALHESDPALTISGANKKP
jgi:hypothetical protein